MPVKVSTADYGPGVEARPRPTGTFGDVVTIDTPAGDRGPTARDVRLNVGWYRVGRHDPTTWIGPTWMVRAMLTPDGPATGRLDWSAGLRVAAWGPGAAFAEAAMLAMSGHDRFDRRMALPAHAHPLVIAADRRHPYLTAGASGDLYHQLLPTVIAQRITAGEAVRQWTMLARRLGAPAPGPFPGLLLPPEPRRLARIPTWWFHPLGIERKRAAALVSVARVADHLWDWARLPSPAEVAAKLLLVPGIGHWTVGMVLGPVWGDDNALAIGDYHFPHTVSWNLAGEPRGDDDRMLELLEPYRPYRGRVLRLLGLSGRRAPAFGPKRRILPMHRF
jgi:3-methyladenine DNA glycosylase/8-oxoguanine DNA glycosylase